MPIWRLETVSEPRIRTRLPLLAIAAISGLVLAPASAHAQGNAQHTVRVNARVEIPTLLLMKPVTAAVASWEGSSYTEYQIRVQVATNAHWELFAESLPEGVTLLAEDGYYWDGAGVVSERGAPTNWSERLVRVRVAYGAPDSWEMQLRLSLREAR